MGVFREKTPPVFLVVLLLAAVFCCCYPVTELGKMELFRNEGFYAAMALETGSFPVVSRVHGEIVANTYPLYPLLVKCLYSLGLSMEFSLRILPVFFLAVLSFVVGFACYKAASINSMLSLLRGEFSPEEVRKNSGKELSETERTLPLTERELKKESRRAGIQAGAVGACLIFATALAGEKTLEGAPVILTALLIYGGWLLWFFAAVSRDSWNIAWLLAFLAASAAFYNGGWYALGFFFIPMLFLKRPLKFSSRLRYGGFYAGLFLLLLTILIWEIPRWDGTMAALEEAGPLRSFGKYLKNICFMPLDLCIRFLPWTFFLYAPLCPALTAIDRNRLFMTYLRRLFVSALLFFWLNPVTESLDFLLLAPVLATLTALDYWIVVRRYGEEFCKVLGWIAPVFLLGGICAVLLYVLPSGMLTQLFERIPEFGFLRESNWKSIPGLFAVLTFVFACFSWYFALRRKQRCVWLSLLLLFGCMMSFFWAFTVPYRCARQGKKEAALKLRSALGEAYSPEMTIYMDGRISGLYEEGFYLGTKIRQIHNSREFAEEKDKAVYVITARNIPPGDAGRSWSRLVELNYRNRKLYIWKGALNVRKYTSEEEAIRKMQF